MTAISIKSSLHNILSRANSIAYENVYRAKEVIKERGNSIVHKFIPKEKLNVNINLNQYPFIPVHKASKGAIVLCHGLYGYDIKGPQQYPFLQTHYWPGVKETLNSIGNEVYITKVSQTGTIEQRANELNDQLNKICEGKQVNLIGHSMGGLDSRYLISHIKHKNYKINSLTTISTPHRGSSLMDYFRDLLTVGLPENHPTLDKDKDKYIYRFIRYLLDQPAYLNLNSDYMNNFFNPNTLNSNQVKYFSYSTKVDQAPLHPLLFLPYHIISKLEGDNDGVVSVDSAKWGVHLGTINSSHMGLLDDTNQSLSFICNQAQCFNTKELFLSISNHLFNQGL